MASQTPYQRAMSFVEASFDRLKLSKATRTLLQTPQNILKSTVSFTLDNKK